MSETAETRPLICPTGAADDVTGPTFTDDAAILVTREDPTTSSAKLHCNISRPSEWAEHAGKYTHIAVATPPPDSADGHPCCTTWLCTQTGGQSTSEPYGPAPATRTTRVHCYPEDDQHYRQEGNHCYAQQCCQLSGVTAFSDGRQAEAPNTEHRWTQVQANSQACTVSASCINRPRTHDNRQMKTAKREIRKRTQIREEWRYRQLAKCKQIERSGIVSPLHWLEYTHREV
jgi:hypothetical protein